VLRNTTDGTCVDHGQAHYQRLAENCYDNVNRSLNAMKILQVGTWNEQSVNYGGQESIAWITAVTTSFSKQRRCLQFMSMSETLSTWFGLIYNQ